MGMTVVLLSDSLGLVCSLNVCVCVFLLPFSLLFHYAMLCSYSSQSWNSLFHAFCFLCCLLMKTVPWLWCNKWEVGLHFIVHGVEGSSPSTPPSFKESSRLVFNLEDILFLLLSFQQATSPSQTKHGRLRPTSFLSYILFLSYYHTLHPFLPIHQPLLKGEKLLDGALRITWYWVFFILTTPQRRGHFESLFEPLWVGYPFYRMGIYKGRGCRWVWCCMEQIWCGMGWEWIYVLSLFHRG